MPTFSTPTPVSATIEIAMGDVRITATDRDDTVVDVRPSDESREADVRAAEQIRVDLVDGRLRVVGPRRRLVGPTKKTGSVDIVIALPTGSHVDADTAMGSIDGTGRLGECKIATSMGDIRLQDTAALEVSTGIGTIDLRAVGGDLGCTTGSGAVRVGEVDGRAYVKNSNGDTWVGDVRSDLRIKAANGGISVERARDSVVAATANGSVRVGCLERGTVELKTAAGQIDVGILAGTAARLTLHTSFGVVRNQLDATDRPGPTETTVDVHAQTSYGDIVITRARTDEP
jgi:DUF4097 and DUF4098 domain-containing protein YvlB